MHTMKTIDEKVRFHKAMNTFYSYSGTRSLGSVFMIGYARTKTGHSPLGKNDQRS